MGIRGFRFGYGGFVLPESALRSFSTAFHFEKGNLYKEFIEDEDQCLNAESLGAWEIKGASLIRASTPETNPQNIRIFNYLALQVVRLGVRLFYYAAEKPLGTPTQTSLDQRERETFALQEALNRLARYADSKDENLMVIMDRVNEKERSRQASDMYAHIFSRSHDYPDSTC